MSKLKTRPIRSKNILRHPIHEFQKQLDQGKISCLPALSREFTIAVPADQDFVIRCYGRGGRPIEARFLRASANPGELGAFIASEFEVELIGTNAERYERATLAKRKKLAGPKTKK